MAEIIASQRINHPIGRVFATAQQIERFPAVLPDVDRVTVLENDGAGRVVSKWEGTVSLGPLTRRITWTESDLWDDSAKTCTFKLVEGDMKRFDGTWTFTPGEGDTTDVVLRVDFELGIPVLGPMVNRIVDQLMQQNCEQLVGALEKLSGE